MRLITGTALLLAVATVAAGAQGTQQPYATPTPRSSTGPFSSDWAKPFPSTGGYFYNDPRLQNSQQPQRPRRQTACPRGSVLNPATGACG
jgi:hypothetical protein